MTTPPANRSDVRRILTFLQEFIDSGPQDAAAIVSRMGVAPDVQWVVHHALANYAMGETDDDRARTLIYTTATAMFALGVSTGKTEERILVVLDGGKDRPPRSLRRPGKGRRHG